MPRTVETILRDQSVTMADLVKAANLNAQHMPCSQEHAALLVAQVLTGDIAEVEALHIAITDALEISEEDAF